MYCQSEVPNFTSFDDKTLFSSVGIIGFYYQRNGQKNFHSGFSHSKHQRQFYFNLRAVLTGDGLLRTYVLPLSLTGVVLSLFPTKYPSRAVSVVDLQTSICLWFMHECALLHFVIADRAFLKYALPIGRIGRSGAAA